MVLLVQKGLPTNKKSKDPALVCSMRLRVSAGLQYGSGVLEEQDPGQGGNGLASESEGRQAESKPSFFRVLYPGCQHGPD